MLPLNGPPTTNSNNLLLIRSYYRLSYTCPSAVYRGFEPQSGQRLKHWYLLLLCYARSINEKEQRLVGSESGQCIRVGRHFYPRNVVS